MAPAVMTTKIHLLHVFCCAARRFDGRFLFSWNVLFVHSLICPFSRACAFRIDWWLCESSCHRHRHCVNIITHIRCLVSSLALFFRLLPLIWQLHNCFKYNNLLISRRTNWCHHGKIPTPHRHHHHDFLLAHLRTFFAAIIDVARLYLLFNSFSANWSIFLPIVWICQIWWFWCWLVFRLPFSIWSFGFFHFTIKLFCQMRWLIWWPLCVHNRQNGIIFTFWLVAAPSATACACVVHYPWMLRKIFQ